MNSRHVDVLLLFVEVSRSLLLLFHHLKINRYKIPIPVYAHENKKPKCEIAVDLYQTYVMKAAEDVLYSSTGLHEKMKAVCVWETVQTSAGSQSLYNVPTGT